MPVLYTKKDGVLEPVVNDGIRFSSNDHSKFRNLDYEKSGHTGFASDKKLKEEEIRSNESLSTIRNNDINNLTTHTNSSESHLVIRGQLSNLETRLQDVSNRISAREGIGGYVKSHDFGTDEPIQSDITTYVKSCIWPDNPTGHADIEIFNGTRVTNNYDNITWALSNTPNSNPPVFIWEQAGVMSVDIATESEPGAIRSSNDPFKLKVDNVTGIGTINTLSSVLNEIRNTVGTLEAKEMTDPKYFADIVNTVSLNSGVIYNTASVFGNLSTIGLKWSGGVLAPNGKIYCMPYNHSQILVIDPTNDTTELFGSFSGSDKWSGGVLAPNGKIYCIPRNGKKVLVIDPSNNTYDMFGDFPSATAEFGVLAPNGKIYCMPSGTQVLVIDPSNNTTYRISLEMNSSISWRWNGAVLAPNGKIYCIPYNSDQIVCIDPSNDTYDKFGNFGGEYTYKWTGGVLAPNGKIYGMPSSNKQPLCIDPSNNTYELLNPVGSNISCNGGVLGSDGKIYGIPTSTNSPVLCIDPSNNSYSSFGSFPSGQPNGGGWEGGVLAPNGKIYGIPRNGTLVLSIEPNTIPTNFSEKTLLSAYLNKF